MITALKEYEVFVFGSNRAGFHGAGAAGYAMRGTAANTWRTDEAFLRAMKAPVGHIDRIGRWAVYGVGRGWQKGHHGMSYAIQTIERPGLKRSTMPGEIRHQIVDLCAFACEHPGWTFLYTEIGAGLSGYTKAEMKNVLDAALIEANGCPGNLIVPVDIYT